MKRLVIAFASVVFFAACEKEEELLPGEFRIDTPGSANLVSEPGMDYQMQVYFDLSTEENKGSNLRDAWDLALGCDPNHPNLFTNPAMLAKVAATGSNDFNALYKTEDYSFSHERARHFFRSGLMMKMWNGTTPDDQVFIINLGKTMNNKDRGYKLFQVAGFDGSSYSIRFSDLDHSNLQEVTIPVDEAYNHVYVSFENVSDVLTLEPGKEEWDILFTKYMERLYDGTDTLDYSVTGALLNPHKTVGYFHEESYADSTWNYTDLSIKDVEPNRYSQRSDVIGHNWKYYDLDLGKYSVIMEKCYFVKDAEERNYRFHFTGFQDAEGKGNIKFEYLHL